MKDQYTAAIPKSSLQHKTKPGILGFSLTLMLLTAIGGMLSFRSLAEGTKQMTTTSSANNVELQINRSNSGGFASKFAGWQATSANDRLYIHINNYSTEKIYLGFKKASSSQTVYYRIKNPAGTVISGPTAIPGSGNGYISSWSQANIGPNTLTGNSSGYTPITVTLGGSANTQMNGDYYIEFNTHNATANTDEIFLSYYDITVASGTSNSTIKPGRLWSYNWGFNSGDYTFPNGSCYGSMYVYSSDSIVTEVDLNGLSPYYFRIFANSVGVNNTGNMVNDRKSENNGSSNPNEIPEFKLFLSNPDVDAYPSAVAADRSATFNSLTGCPGSYCFNITVNGAALAELRLDLNNNGSYTDAVDRKLEANVTGGANCIPWDGLNGQGVAVANNTTLKLDMYTKVGTLHIPVYDAEENNKGFRAAITRPTGIGIMTLYWDDSQITSGTSELNGVTANAPLTGTNTGTGGHSWLDPFGNTKTINTWFTTKKTVISNYSLTFTKYAASITASTNVSCFGQATGSATATPQHGTAPYTYSWNTSPSQTTATATNLAAGVYICTVTDATGCVDTAVATITQPSAALSVACSNTSPGGYGMTNGTAAVSATGGTAPYTYLWSNAGTTASISSLVSGSYSVTVTDNKGCTSSCSTVLNAFPFAVWNAVSTNEDTPVSGSVTGNDVQSADGGNVWSLLTAASNGTVTVNAAGNYTYTPNANFNGTDQFVYKLCDANNDCDTAIVYITITAVNDLPVAIWNAATTNEDVAVSGTVAGNDVLSGDGGNTWSLVTGATNGTATIDASGNYTYTPNANYNGNDQFVYQLCDANNDCDTAVVYLTITPVNDVPVAIWNAATTNEDVPVTGSVAGNDNLSGDGGNTWSLVTGAANGTVTVNANGGYTYTPNANFNGNDQFVYKLCDANNDCDTAIVYVTIAAVNDVPVAVWNAASTNEDTPVSGSVNGNDVLSGDGSNTWSLVTGAANGTVTVGATGNYTYTPNLNFNGNDQFIYQLCDVNNDCDTAVVYITVTSVNDVPVAVWNITSTNEDTPVSGSVTGNDVLSGDGGNTWSLVTGATNGTVTINAAGNYTYTPNANYNGNDQFVYNLCDINNDCDTAVVYITINPVNDVPVGHWNITTTNEDVPVSGSVTGNDILSGDGGNTWALVTGAANGTVTVNALGDYTYTPNANFHGNDQFVYNICDANNDCDTAVVYVSIASVNDVPVAVWNATTTNEDVPVSGSVTGNDILSGDGGNTWALITGAANGSVTVNANGSYTYTPNANFNGNDQFVYNLCDANNDCDTAIVYVTISAINDAPVAMPDFNATNVNTQVPGSVAGNDTDPDGNLNIGSFTLSCTSCVSTSNGTLILNPNGSYTYTPNNGFTGTDQFVYQACDNGTPSLCDTAVVFIQVTGTPVTPAVTISTPITAICSGTPVTFTATPTDGGTNPVFQWKKNGNNVGTNSITYSDAALNNNDVVSVQMTSNAPLATPPTVSSNAITMTVTAAAAQPAAFTVASPSIYWGQTTATYTVPAVSGVSYTWNYTGTGVTLTGTGNSITLSVAQGATSGTLSVTASNTCGTSVARTMSINVLPYMTWQCGGNNDWNNSANWDGGFVPYSTINVMIPASASCQPELPSDFCVRDLTVQSGASVAVPATSTLCVNGSFNNDGSICSGIVKMSGSSAQNISGNGTVCNFELSNPNGATITSGDTLHIVKTYVPTDGTLNTNGGLILLSDSLNGTASILAPSGTCSNYINGNVVVNKWIHGGRRAFRFLAHPFSVSIGMDQLTDDIDITGQGGSANGFTTSNTNNPSAFWYNTITANGSASNDSTGWIPYTHTNGLGANSWNPMQGSRVFIRGDKGQGLGCIPCFPGAVTIDMTAPVNQCDVTVALQTNANMSYNFIGNPYPSNVDLSLVTRGSAVGPNFSVWDPNQGVYGAYIAQPFDFSYVLPAYSSMIVTATANTNNNITFHEAAKTAAEPTHTLFKTTGSSFGASSLQLKITSNNDSINWDRILMFFDGSANSGTETRDAKKLVNPSLDFYSMTTDNNKLAIDVRPVSVGDVIPLGLRVDSQRTYAIRVADYEAPAGIQLYLRDKFVNQTVAMTQGMSYSFQVNSNPLSQGDARFEINAGVSTGTGNLPSGNGIEIAMVPNPATEQVTISLGGVKGNSTVTITDMMGQIVSTTPVEGTGSVNVSLQDWAAGIYIVTIRNGNAIKTEKLVKK